MDDLNQIPGEPEISRGKKPALIVIMTLVLAVIGVGSYFLLTKQWPPGKNGLFAPKRKIVSEKILVTIPDEHGIVTIDKIFVSKNGEHFAYIAKNAAAGKEFVVVDGKKLKPYDAVRSFLFSADGKNFAYVAETKNAGNPLKKAVLNEKESKFNYMEILDLVFSSDGNNPAYRAVKQNGKWIVIYNEKEGKEYGGVANLIFSPDAKHFAYRAVLKEEQV